MTWNPLALPDQRGRTHVVTGSTAGIGYFAAEQLAEAGARVVLAARSADRLESARRSIRARIPAAEVETVALDLASLESVRSAASALSLLGPIDGLFLNGGAMQTTTAVTADGLPILLGTHVVANAALIDALLPVIRHRIVHASTGFVRLLRLDIDDIRTPQRGFLRTYTQAKTVTELYAYELDRRLRATDHPAASIVVHPGVGVDAKTPARPGVYDPLTQRRRNPFTPWAQGKDAAAWSGVRALTDPTLVGGDYLGPSNGRRGVPARLDPLPHTSDAGEHAAHAWEQVHELALVRA